MNYYYYYMMVKMLKNSNESCRAGTNNDKHNYCRGYKDNVSDDIVVTQDG